MLPNVDRTIGAAPERQGLRVLGGPPGRRRRHQRAITRAGGRRNCSTDRSIQMGQAHPPLGSTQAVATAMRPPWCKATHSRTMRNGDEAKACVRDETAVMAEICGKL